MAPDGAPRPYDVVLLGYGFYGARVLQRLVELLPGDDFRIGVAGRHVDRLRATLEQLQLTDRVDVIGPLDASNYMAMKTVAAETRVILAVLPDYRVVGDAVVRACAEEGTHYFDLGMDMDQLVEWRELYGEAAAANNCVIARACGYDYVVIDYGALDMSRLFVPPGSLTSVDVYVTMSTGPRVVLREAWFHKLLDKANQHGSTPPSQQQRNPPAKTAGGALQPAPGGTSLLRRLLGALPLQYNRQLGLVSLPGPRSEATTVRQTWELLQGADSTPLAVSSRVVVSSLSSALVFVGYMGVYILAKLAPTRWLLGSVVAPALRRLGVLTQDDKEYEAAVSAVSLKKVFVGRGFLGGPDSSGQPGREVERVLTLTASGYEVTITAPPLAALCVLTEREQVDVVGFNTVAAALHKTSFWRRLKERCHIEGTWSELAAGGGARAKTE